ncbi:MAG TPA: hypothetical protein DCZ05_09395 [Deltaproteobacteria bacterium]|nr:hypothetical protein [Deltaproteobacteria bacterium]
MDELREKIIAAIEVHKTLSPGLLESIYEEALCVELELREAAGLKRGLLVNFGVPRRVDGIRRISL